MSLNIYVHAPQLKQKQTTTTQTYISKPTHRFLYFLFFINNLNNRRYTSFFKKRKKKEEIRVQLLYIAKPKREE